MIATLAKTLLSMLSSYVTKELLLDLFKDVVMDYVLEEMDEFVKDTETTADDKLLKEFSAWYRKRAGS